jgi:hypothetical protein
LVARSNTSIVHGREAGEEMNRENLLVIAAQLAVDLNRCGRAALEMLGVDVRTAVCAADL